jgi:hypothetical protein
MAEQTISVEIPVEIYKELERRARFGETLPDVVRRLIDEEVDVGGGTPDPEEPLGRGYLLELIQAGYLEVGQELFLELPRKGVRSSAVVTRSGEIELSDGRRFASPTGGANACLGGSNNGWIKWRLKDDGRTLDDVRAEMRKNR